MISKERQVLQLCMRTGELLLRNGAEIFRVEETMVKIAAAYDAKPFHVYVVTNGIFACVGEEDQAHSTEIRQVPLSPVHLGRVAAINDLSRGIVAGHFTLEQAFTRLSEIESIPYASRLRQVLAAGLGSACFCYIFGGGIYDSLTALISGALLWIFILFAGKKHFSKLITNILGSAFVTLCGLCFFNLGMGTQMDKIIIGSIIPLVPGVPLTTSIRDFFNSDYLSGTIRLIDALLIASCIAIGVGFSLMLSNFFAGVLV